MARQTKAEIQAELDELLTTLKPRLEELVDIVAAHQRAHSKTARAELDRQLQNEVRATVRDLRDLPAWESVFPDGERVRGTAEVYRDLALEVAES